MTLFKVNLDRLNKFVEQVKHVLLSTQPERKVHVVRINGDVSLYVTEYPYNLDIEHENVIGIDPGRFVGVAAWDNSQKMLRLMNVTLESAGQNKYKYLFSAFEMAKWLAGYTVPQIAVIEGASHNEKYGQDLLSQIRGVIDVAFELDNIKTYQVPPLLLRKLVWGSGKNNPTKFFPHINPHSADALSCLVYGIAVVV